METEIIRGHVSREAEWIKRAVVQRGDILFDFIQTDPSDAADRTGEVGVDKVLRQTDGLEDFCRLIGLQRADPHLGGDLDNTVQNGLVVIRYGSIEILVQSAGTDQFSDALMGEIRTDGARAESQCHSELVNVPWLRTLQDQGNLRALFGCDQMLFHRGYGQERRNCHVVFVHSAVRQDNDVEALCVGAVYGDAELVQCFLQGSMLVVQKRNYSRHESGLVQLTDLHQVHFRQDRIFHLQHPDISAGFLQQVAVGTDIDGCVGDDLFAKRIDRRIGHLGKQLLEIVRQRPVFLRENGKRDIVAHGGRHLGTVFRHGKNLCFDILIAVLEETVETASHVAVIAGHAVIGHRQGGQMFEVPVQPFAVRLAAGIKMLAFLVRNDALLLRIDQQDAAGSETVFLYDVFIRDIQHADF